MYDKLSQEEKDFIHNLHQGVSGIKDPAEIYNTVAKDYDKVADLVGIGMLAKRLVEVLCQHIEKKDLSGVSAIDIACGTGSVGVELAAKGFKEVHGLDNSQEMIEVSRKKNVYMKLFTALLNVESTPGLADNTYDVATACCFYEEGTVPMDTVREVLRIIKPGGVMAFSVQYKPNTFDYMNALGELIKEELVELQEMKLVQYARDPETDFDEWCNGYVVALKKL